MHSKEHGTHTPNWSVEEEEEEEAERGQVEGECAGSTANKCGGSVRVSNVTTHQQEGCFAFRFPILIILYSFINNWPNAVDAMLFRTHVDSRNRRDTVCG